METGRAMREASLEEKDASLFLHVLVLKYSPAFQNGKSSRQMYTLSVIGECYAENINFRNIKLYMIFKLTGLGETTEELCFKRERIDKEQQ